MTIIGQLGKDNFDITKPDTSNPELDKFDDYSNFLEIIQLLCLF